MSLSCYCNDYCEWYYEFSEHEYTACSAGQCYGCRDKINIGQEVKQIFSYDIDEDGSEINCQALGRICEKCVGHYQALTDLGYCVTVSRSAEAGFPGFIDRAMDEYRETLPKEHKITKPWKRGKAV